MAACTLYEYEVDAKRFDAAPRPDRVLFVTALNAMRDITAMQKCVAASLNGAPWRNHQRILMDAQIGQAVFFARVALSLTCGAFEALTQSGVSSKAPRRKRQSRHTVSTEYARAMRSRARTNLLALEAFFDQHENGFLKIVRSRLTFHYDLEQASWGLQGVSEVGATSLYFSEYQRSCVYPFADQATIHAVVDAMQMPWKNHRDAIMQFVALSKEVGERLTRVLAEVVDVFCSTHLGAPLQVAADKPHVFRRVPALETPRLPAVVGDPRPSGSLARDLKRHRPGKSSISVTPLSFGIYRDAKNATGARRDGERR